MKRLRATSFLTLMLFLLVAGQAAGQKIDSPYRFIDQKQSIGPFAGYLFTTEGTVGLAPKSGPIFGGRYTIRLSGPFVIEAEVGYFNSTRPVRDTVLVVADSSFLQVGTADFSTIIGTGALRFNLTGPRTWHGIQPYFLFAAGAAVGINGDSPEDTRVQADARFDFGTSFAGQVGGGIELFPSSRFTLRIDGRNLLWKIKSPPAFLLSRIGDIVPDDEWVQNGFVSASFTLHF